MKTASKTTNRLGGGIRRSIEAQPFGRWLALFGETCGRLWPIRAS
jgi:hypothetical protein